jgi:limonene-1,2-epoxide hydrolase
MRSGILRTVLVCAPVVAPGVQVNAMTKAGTNNYAGTLSGFFRDDSLIAADPIVNRVLPYSNQQISTTFGGPVVRDRAHIFGYYEGEREPQSYFFNCPYPAFNIEDLTGTRTEHKTGARFDGQINPTTRLMTRGNYWKFSQPYTDSAAGGSTGGATVHPSRASWKNLESATWFANLTKTIGGKLVNELKPGYNYITSQDIQVVQSPQILLQGYTIGQESFKPLFLTEKTWSVRDDLSYIGGRHEMKVGAEYFCHLNTLYWPSNKYGTLDALGGAIPADIESLFGADRLQVRVLTGPFAWTMGAGRIRIMHEDNERPGRRQFLATSVAGAAAVLALSGVASAAEMTAAEKANVKVVTDMCAAWTAPVDFDKIGGYLAEDCIFRASEAAPPIKGRQAIIDGLKKMLGSPEKARFDIVQTFARGPLVVNERFDRFTMSSKSIDWNGVGVFYVKNGLIAEWSDYTIRMA